MPYVEKLEMKGFKSYGSRKIVVPFSRGFTAIVGANGSGKSNIGDAILFVLGGLSAKAMRATRIGDLIFAGTKDEPPAKYAEVAMYFNNEDRGFPIDEDEVVIKRRVYPDGRSAYWLNGKRTSRSDILDVLSAAMISPDGYNLVLQGDITKFIKMSPTERRMIIDEISGIAEYDEKKKKAMEELKQAEENLARVDLLIREVKTQLDKLEKERNDALRYLDLKEKLEIAKTTLLVGEVRRLENLIATSQERDKEIESEIERINEELEKIAKTILEKEKTLSQVERELEEKSEDGILDVTKKISEVTSQIELAKKNIELARKEINESKRRLTKVKEELKTVSEEIEKGKSAIERWKKRREKLLGEIQKKEKERNELILKLAEIDKNFTIAKQELDKVEEDLENAKKEQYFKESEITKMTEEIERIKARNSQNSTRRLVLKNKIEELKEEINSKKSELSEIDSKIERAGARVRKIEKELEEVQRKLEKITPEIKKLNEELIKAEARKEISQNRTLEALKKANIPGIYGSLAELIKVRDDTYLTAVEVALGSHADNVVVKDDKVAEKAINFLKRNKLGRLTFLPLNKIRPRKLNGTSKGIPVMDVIEYDPQFRNAVSFAVGDTLIVNDMDEAREVGIGKVRMVTLEGELLERSGAIVGGYYRPRTKLAVNTDEIRMALEAREREKEQLESKINALKLEQRGLERELFELRMKKSDVSKDLQMLQKDMERFLNEDKGLKEEIEMGEQRLKELEERIHQTKGDLAKLSGRIERLEKMRNKLRKALDNPEARELNQKIREVEHEISGLREELSKIESRLENLDIRINDELIPRKANLEEEIEGLINRINAFKASIVQNEEDIKSLQERLKELQEKEQEVKDELKSLRDEREKLREEISQMREEKEKLRDVLQKLRLEANSIKIRMAQYEAQLKEKTSELKHHDVKVVKEIPEDLEKLREEIEQMEDEIRKLEPVNMKAIEDYEVVERRYLELKSKRERLEAEKESIVEFINEIESQKRNVFMQTLNAIAKNFSELFAKLSPGGEAKLVLENEEDPFSGGLDIEAKPAGKEVKRIEAMSGGEKALTALAFVFAIQHFKPAPFYLFDEIDAHLDDANVKRVADLIKEASKDSQFIVITLRDVMMSNADKIIGVSMRRGVSRVVSLSLEKAMQYLEKARAKNANALGL
ncbi:chromosome segregation protein SMC [Thermococcus argininiproducens]|uniref:Chromosome partition protein Smc n=1 Tax=Thermococcus argininiproducens TaxID=2866384 RepID=A0A9E7SBV4_9EURY|nr:chromosome segregation protein SMC [Thermococcus argininiproducens]USG99244.1 chromosome segregation protein SMC [Thermococcus argininiproducens]